MHTLALVVCVIYNYAAKVGPTWSYLHYNNFSLGSGSEEYPLTVGGFTGVGTDLFNPSSYPHNGMKFTTPDNDNDNYSSSNCAVVFKNGWWHNHCSHINPNDQPPYAYFSSSSYTLFMEMKIRPKDCIIQLFTLLLGLILKWNTTCISIHTSS